MNILVYGATSRIAHECARLWAREGHRLVLCGRDGARLDEIAADLHVASPAGIMPIALVLGIEDDANLQAGIVHADTEFGPFDVALIAHGWLPEQAAAQADPAQLRRALEVNAVSVAHVCEPLAALFEARGRGTLAVIGSVAGDRGRQSNYIYGAAKGFVERYCQGLRNRLDRHGVRVVLVKPGPTDTPMTQAMARPPGARQPKLADPRQVARTIVGGIRRGQSVVYAPPIWRVIMLVIRSIPESIFVRLKL